MTNTVDILDLMHVLPRVWEAAHLFHHGGKRRGDGSSYGSDCLTRI